MPDEIRTVKDQLIAFIKVCEDCAVQKWWGMMMLFLVP